MERWRTLAPADIAVFLAPVTVEWWIAGGWAMDLFVGSQSRPHNDFDVSCFSPDAAHFFAALPEWEIRAAVDGQLIEWSAGNSALTEAHSFWCRPAGVGEWHFQVLTEQLEEDEWRFRRDSSIRRPRDSVCRVAGGFRVIKPEIQLLYKSKAVRDRDQMDFELVMPHLSDHARAWLSQNLRHLYPQHRWMETLEGGLEQGSRNVS